jgi:uncharacterized protein YndB with AHSA1/START domain
MLKTLGIGCLVILVLIAGGVWFGYRKMVAGGDTAAVTIAATPARVFASLANHDSLRTWMVSLRGRETGRHGAFAEGDTAMTDSSAIGRQRRHARWIVTSVTPNQQVTLELRTDSSGLVVATRRDSLVGRGDSTTVISTIASGIGDAVRARGGANGGGAQTVLDASSKMIVAGMRIAAEADLKNLKNHLEGRPAAVFR